MASKRVTSWFSAVLLVLLCGINASFAATQGRTSSSPTQTLSPLQFSSQLQTKARAHRRGPVTPGELAVQAPRTNAAKSRPFIIPPAPQGAIFLSAIDYDTAGQSTRAVAAADLNHDGKIDMVTAEGCTNNCASGGISVLLGNGDGTFQTAVAYSSGGEDATAVAIADLNGDGIPDVVVANDCASNSNCNNGSLSVLLGNGDGTFQPAVSYISGGQGTLGLALADVNGDGFLDLIDADNCAAGNCSNGSVSVFLGNGNGTFQNPVTYTLGAEGAVYVAAGDLNGDGKLDLAVVSSCVSSSTCASGGLSVLLGNGDGTFQAAVTYSTTAPDATGVAIGDINGDGHMDLAVSNSCSNSNNCDAGSINIFLGNGDGTFQAAVGYGSGGNNAAGIVLTDINGDGKPDVLVANVVDLNGNWMDGAVASVLLGNGDGTFQTPVTYAAGNYSATSITLADVNGDGNPDILLGSNCADNYNCLTGAVGVLLGTGTGAFQAGISYNSDAWATYSVAMADVNGDGKLDLLLGNECNNAVSCNSGVASVLLGNGDGTFQPGVAYNSGGLNSLGITVGDVNGDGKPDLLLANECTDNNCTVGSVSVLLGNGDGTFQPQVSYSSGGIYTYSIVLGDVNGDGIPDLIAASQCSNSNCTNGEVSVLLGNGDGTFQSAVPYNSAGFYTFAVALADVNGDGKLDIVLDDECNNNSSCSSGVISVLLSNGDGTFQPAVGYNSGGAYPFTVAVGDVNGDGKPDVVVSNQCGNTSNCNTGALAVLLGNGDGTLQTATTTTTPVMGGLHGMILADLNGDHNLDVASGEGNLLMLGNGDGTSQAPLALGATGAGIAIGDVNGDGRPDIAVGGVVVLLNISTGWTFPTTTALTSTLTPSTYGASVTFTATVGAQVTGTPTGTVTFSDGSNTLGSGTLSAGTATYSTSTLAVGSHSITATYSGDSNFVGSVSASFSQAVQQAGTTVGLNAPATANVNQSVTFTATVSPQTSGTPTGTVTFMDGSTQIGSGSLTAGVATFSTSSLAAGAHSITAVYGGDSNFTGSTSSASSLTVTAAGFTLSSSALSSASVMPGSSAQSTITITPSGGLDPSSVSLTCAASPAVTPAVTCSLGSITSGQGVGSATLTVSTTGPHSALVPGQERTGRLLMYALLLPGLFLCGAGINKPNRRKFLAFAFVCLILTGCMFQAACSSGSSSTTNNSPGTPAGTYTVTVTGNASGVQQTTSVSLTVQ
ncbi:MAG TPA: FG-GAP-like repeat-containing protein [Candidatus Binatia bacterium]|nr:FG-GAP-like repeat-containing protein [Candidatus Binatia bacterium]